MAKIFVLDDDLAIEALVDQLNSRGHEAERIPNSGTTAEIVEKLIKADLVILDVIMQRPPDMREAAAHGGHRTGFVLAQKLHQMNSSLPIVAYSATQDMEVQAWFRSHSNLAFITKLGLPGLEDVTKRIERYLSPPGRRALPKVFIVHGHDEAAKYSLKNYLQNVLGFPEPIILHEQASQGRILLEKFEHYSAQADVIFVLLTPDDRLVDVTAGNAEKRRARQNVVLELGYFLGTIKRSSGRVLLLHRGPLELPSDIIGLVYIDISNGIEAAGEAIRRELDDVIGR